MGTVILNCSGRLFGKVKMTLSRKALITSCPNFAFFPPLPFFFFFLFFSFLFLSLLFYFVPFSSPPHFLFSLFELGAGKKEKFATFQPVF